MYRTVLLVGLLPVPAYGAGECAAPQDALAKLEGYLTYMSSRGLWSPGAKRFSFAQADGDALFLQRELPQRFDEKLRLVYVFRKGSHLMVNSCPNNPQWTECAEKDFQDFIHAPANTPKPRIGPTCDLTVTVPQWRPSPNSPLKTRLASEVLQELMQYGYINPREVYVRDFNVADPELDFYIIDRVGERQPSGLLL